MSAVKRILVPFAVFAMSMFLGIGYAKISRNLQIGGSVQISPVYDDIYISSVTPESDGGAAVTWYYNTALKAEIFSSDTANFNITVRNQSDKSYVFERLIYGSETGIDGIYTGDGVTAALTGLSSMQALEPLTSLTFRATLSISSGVVTDAFFLKFNFIEKTGSEILPGNPDPEPDPEPEPTPNPEFHDDFLGLVEAILSENDKCLNDQNQTLIFDAVMDSLNSSKRPDGHAPIVHCQVKSISGGTMSSVMETVNQNIKNQDLHFIFEAYPEPEYQDSRLVLYMYHGIECEEATDGEEILVYKQIVKKNSDGVWVEDGTYIGRAEVGEFFGGGNSGALVRTINPYTWKAGAPENLQ